MLQKSRNSKMVGALTLLLLAGCAAPSPPTPPVIADQVKLTPLPSTVTQIDSQSSAGYLQKASTWLQKVGQSLGDGTQK